MNIKCATHVCIVNSAYWREIKDLFGTINLPYDRSYSQAFANGLYADDGK